MFIGHLPGGYLAARALWRKCQTPLIVATLIGSVLPDIDMLWFHFIDQGGVHHHTYLTHRPALWATIALLGIAARKPVILAIGLGALVHMLLDSIVGSIAWGWPFVDHAHPLVVVPATRANWVMSFLTHWTFLVEIVLTLTAATLAIVTSWQRRKKA